MAIKALNLEGEVYIRRYEGENSKILYPLAVTSFTESQALSITCHLYQTLLPRLGVNHHYPLVLHHIPAKFHGLELLRPYWEQGLAGLKLFWNLPTLLVLSLS